MANYQQEVQPITAIIEDGLLMAIVWRNPEGHHLFFKASEMMGNDISSLLHRLGIKRVEHHGAFVGMDLACEGGDKAVINIIK